MEKRAPKGGRKMAKNVQSTKGCGNCSKKSSGTNKSKKTNTTKDCK